MSMVPAESDFCALDVMFALRLENGQEWGAIADPHQKADAVAVFGTPGGPNKHFITRPRGGSKTTDIAGLACSWLVAEAPTRSRGYVVAGKSEQAAILVDAAGGLVARTPELENELVVENERILNPNTGAWVRVLSQSDSGAWGLRDTHLLILDEFAQWPETRGAKRVYTAVRSTVQKVPGCKLVILTSAGEPEHWSYTEVFKLAKADTKGWRISEMPGPVPWQPKEELEALQRELTPSQYERLVLNIWSADEDRAISPEDYDAAAHPAIVQSHGRDVTLITKGYERPRSGIRYFIFVDIGTVNDATVIVVAHKEPFDKADPRGPQRLVIDRLDRWQGTKKKPVQLSRVEEHIVDLAGTWNKAKVYGDPHQFVGTMQSLKRRGVKVEEFIFGATSVGQVATALVQTFRNRLAVIPDATVLKDELLRVKLRESSPGVARLDHDRSGHDDQAVTIGMAAHTLIGNSGWGSGGAFREFMRTEREKRSEEAPQSRREQREAASFQRGLRLAMARSGGARLRQERDAARCQHRWRANQCVFGCGTTREEQASLA